VIEMDVAANNSNLKVERPKEEVNGRNVEAESILLNNKVICVSLPSLSSKPVKVTAATPEEIIPMVQKANLSWVNYTSTDLETDGVKVAQQFLDVQSEALSAPILFKIHLRYQRSKKSFTT
jgi:hypothetical protein